MSPSCRDRRDGFGSLQAAHALRHAPVRVTVIGRSNYHLFQPLLYQVATADLSPADIAAPIRGIFHTSTNTTVSLAEVTGVDTTCVFKCLQCDLQFQTDIAVVRRNGSSQREEEIIRVRLDPHTALTQDAGSFVSRAIEREVDRAVGEDEEEAFC